MSYCEHCGHKKEEHHHHDGDKEHGGGKRTNSFRFQLGVLIILLLLAGFLYTSYQQLPPIQSIGGATVPTAAYTQNLPIITGGVPYP